MKWAAYPLEKWGSRLRVAERKSARSGAKADPLPSVGTPWRVAAAIGDRTRVLRFERPVVVKGGKTGLGITLGDN